MAGHQLIDEYVAELGRRLPEPTVEELADGLTETWQHHLAAGRTPAEAARAALDEFGDADRVTAAFVAQAPGRRTALVLLATGPVMAACWGTSLVVGRAWAWPVPVAAALLYWFALLTTIAVLIVAATSRRSYRRTRLAAAGAVVLIALDVTMLAVALLVAPALVWPMAAAIPASVARVSLTIRSLPRIITR